MGRCSGDSGLPAPHAVTARGESSARERKGKGGRETRREGRMGGGSWEVVTDDHVSGTRLVKPYLMII